MYCICIVLVLYLYCIWTMSERQLQDPAHFVIFILILFRLVWVCLLCTMSCEKLHEMYQNRVCIVCVLYLYCIWTISERKLQDQEPFVIFILILFRLDKSKSISYVHCHVKKYGIPKTYMRCTKIRSVLYLYCICIAFDQYRRGNSRTQRTLWYLFWFCLD